MAAHDGIGVLRLPSEHHEATGKAPPKIEGPPVLFGIGKKASVEGEGAPDKANSYDGGWALGEVNPRMCEERDDPNPSRPNSVGPPSEASYRSY